MSGNESNTTTQQNRWRNEEQEQESAKNYALSGKIMLASIIVLFVVVVFLVMLHLYARWYLLRLQRNTNRRRNNRNRSSRIVFYVDSNRPPSTPTGGLDPNILKSLPLFIYSSKPDTVAPECSVCLSEFETGEAGRVLPKCKHSFHTECIDMWFHSNSTCPLCRATVEPVQPVHSCECESDVKILIEPGSSGMKDYAEPGSSNVNESVSFGDKRKGLDIRIDVPNRSESRAETGLRIMSPMQGFRSPRNMLMRVLTMSRKSPAVSPSGAGPSFLAPTPESRTELSTESAR